MKPAQTIGKIFSTIAGLTKANNPQESYSQTMGLAPGSLVHIGKKRDSPVRLSSVDYGPDFADEILDATVADCKAAADTEPVSWINVDGVHDVEVVRAFGEAFGLHPLVTEDIMNTRDRPKVEDFDDYLFFTLKMLRFNHEAREVEVEHVGIILGRNLVITFQETPDDIFTPIRNRILTGNGKVRQRGADYLLNLLIDAIVDHYLVVAEAFEEMVEELEKVIMDNSTDEALSALQQFKRELLNVRKAVVPLKEALYFLQSQKTEGDLVTKQTRLYLKDVQDHLVQVLESLDNQRDLLTQLTELHLALLSHRMNGVMKVLTIVSTIFIPLTFLAGIYGMNFHHMPELDERWGYPILLGIMLVVAVVMLRFFRKRRWL